MSPVELTTEELCFAAIRLDLQTLVRSGHPGAIHFARVLQLNPYHLRHKSRLAAVVGSSSSIDVDNSALFNCGEALRLTLSEDAPPSRERLNPLQRTYETDAETALTLLMAAWLDPHPESLTDVQHFTEKNMHTFPREVQARIMLQLMTWTRATAGVYESTPFYDEALQYASGDLRKAIQSVGRDFDREAKLWFKPLRSRLVRYDSVHDLAADGTRKVVSKIAQKRIESPFVRRIGGSTQSTPDELVAAELQAEWAGAYWTLKGIWSDKSRAIVALSKDPDELTDSVADWVLSGDGDLRSLLDEVERHFDDERIDRLLRVHLLDGRRILEENWLDLCDNMTGLLPSRISDALIKSVPLVGTLTEMDSRPSRERNYRLFGRLLANSPEAWDRRFSNLPPDEKLAASAHVRPQDVPLLSESAKTSVCSLLLSAIKDGCAATNMMTLTVAKLINIDPASASKRDLFMATLRPENSTLVALNYEHFARRDLIEERQVALVEKINDEIQKNNSGSWSGFGTSLPLELAQTMIALRNFTDLSIATIQEFVFSPSTSADALLDSVKALVWLFDEQIFTRNKFPLWIDSIPYRDTSNAPVSMWTGRDDVRAINAVLANLKLRTGQNSAEPATRLAFAARDPDISVRLVATEHLRTYLRSSEGNISSEYQSVFDSIALGAVYDPDNRVQANGVLLIPEMRDVTLRALAWARVGDEWARSHTRVRLAAVHTARYMEDRGEDILRIAARDRAVAVRNAATSFGVDPA